jgi:hypothetical protein
VLAELLRKPEPRAWGRSVGAAVAAVVSEGRLPLVLLAQIAADREQTMSEATWRNANPAAARWFTFLGSTGYILADIERRVVNDTQGAPAEERDKPARRADRDETDEDDVDVDGDAEGLDTPT